uniref:Uncharacterized protein n=1 Tax=Arundo donax TaxID=35708 RepID=A0A0A9B731_ARUDO
MCELQYFE